MTAEAKVAPAPAPASGPAHGADAIHTDVLIIGAGPSGTAAASLLRRDGWSVRIVEKLQFPRFVIGESLLPYSMDLLDRAGLLEAAQSGGFMEKRGAVFWRDGETCNFDFANQFTAGWKYTYQVPRAEFDLALADAVAARGAEVLYRHGIQAVDFSNPQRITATLETPEGGRRTVTSRFVLDCSGYGRVLPRLLDLERPSDFPIRESLFTHVTGDLRPEGREEGKIWICINADDAWIWIIPFSDGRTSVGVVAEPSFFERFPGLPAEQLRAILQTEPKAAARLAEAEFHWEPRRITGYACGVKALHGPGFALVGNATEFLDPIFSSGVTLALASGIRAAEVLTRQLKGEPVCWSSEYDEYVMQGINAFRSYVYSWYDGVLPNIFFAAGANPDIMRQICSVLAGYVWDKSNPYVMQPERALPLLAKLVQARQPARP